MFLLNLSLPEFLTLFAAVSGVVVTLYLLSRARRRQVVPTLKFWVHAMQPVPSSRRRRIQQPWSLVLQLLCLALLLLAISQLKLGERETAQRDHVLLLDASSWMGVQAAGGNNRTLLDEAKARSKAFLRSLPASDRVMVVRVDSLPAPATAMESDHQLLERAIDETRTGASALNLDQAFLFAEQIRKLHSSKYGEIVYAGAARVSAAGRPVRTPVNLRILAVEGPRENIGLSRVGARRSEKNPEMWDIFVAVHNYGSAPRRVPVTLQFGGAPVGGTVLDVRPGITETQTFHFATKAAGWIEARLSLRDALADDNRAILELPEFKYVNVAVYTDQPDAIRPVLAAHPQVKAAYYTPSEYKPREDVQVVIADRFNPTPEPKVAAIYIEPPDGSPFRTKSTFAETKRVNWRAGHEITSGIRARDQRVSSGRVLVPGKQDIVLADVEGGGPIALVRPETHAVALGFSPMRGDLRFDLATPLLLANVLRWVEPNAFRLAEVHGSSVGTVNAALEPGAAADPKSIRVLVDKNELPFTIANNQIRFFSGSPGVVRVLQGNREQVYSLSLPEVADADWTVPQAVRRGLPGGFAEAVSRDLWQILAVLGALGLLAEWLFFGRNRLAQGPVAGSATRPSGDAEWRQAS